MLESSKIREAESNVFEPNKGGKYGTGGGCKVTAMKEKGR